MLSYLGQVPVFTRVVLMGEGTRPHALLPRSKGDIVEGKGIKVRTLSL